MTLAPSNEDRPAPRNNEELARDWWGYIAWLGRKLGVDQQDVEDFTQEVICTMISWDAISAYDPKQASFSTYLRGYIVKRCFSFRREAGKRARALRVSPDAPVSRNTEATYGDVMMPADENPYYEMLEFLPVLKQFLNHLEKTDFDLHQVACELTISTMVMDQEVVRPLLAERLEISVPLLDLRLKQLRAVALEWGLAPPEVEEEIALKKAAKDAAKLPGEYLTSA